LIDIVDAPLPLLQPLLEFVNLGLELLECLNLWGELPELLDICLELLDLCWCINCQYPMP